MKERRHCWFDVIHSFHWCWRVSIWYKLLWTSSETLENRKMTEFYVYLNSQDSTNLRKNNSPSEFFVQFPKSYQLEDLWKCALIEVTLTCDFKPRSSRLYVCCDIVQDSYVRNTSLPVLRNIEISGRYNRIKTETFTNPVYTRIKVHTLDSIRIVLKDENLNPIIFESNDFHCLLHFKKVWAP